MALHRPGVTSDNRFGQGVFPGYNGRTTDHATRTAIVEKYAAGESVASLAREFSLNQTTVRKTLRDAGVELRHRRRGKGQSFDGGS
jgi:transposase-like protein